LIWIKPFEVEIGVPPETTGRFGKEAAAGFDPLRGCILKAG